MMDCFAALTNRRVTRDIKLGRNSGQYNQHFTVYLHDLPVLTAHQEMLSQAREAGPV